MKNMQSSLFSTGISRRNFVTGAAIAASMIAVAQAGVDDRALAAENTSATSADGWEVIEPEATNVTEGSDIVTDTSDKKILLGGQSYTGVRPALQLVTNASYYQASVDYLLNGLYDEVRFMVGFDENYGLPEDTSFDIYFDGEGPIAVAPTVVNNSNSSTVAQIGDSLAKTDKHSLTLTAGADPYTIDLPVTGVSILRIVLTCVSSFSHSAITDMMGLPAGMGSSSSADADVTVPDGEWPIDVTSDGSSVTITFTIQNGMLVGSSGPAVTPSVYQRALSSLIRQAHDGKLGLTSTQQSSTNINLFSNASNSASAGK